MSRRLSGGVVAEGSTEVAGLGAGRRFAPGPLTSDRFEREALPHRRAILGAAYRSTRNLADAQDVVQETFLRAYSSFHLFQPGTNIRAWLFTILRHVLSDVYRRSRRLPVTVELLGHDQPIPPAQETFGLRGQGLGRALTALPDILRSPVVLRDVAELSYAQIAATLHIPVGTVMSRIHRGRARLRKWLQSAEQAPGAGDNARG